MDAKTLELVELGKTYRHRWRTSTVAVDSLDLAVGSGEIVGLLGPNGAGKTTTLRMIAGLAAPTTGEIRLFGRPLERSNRRELLSRVGVLIDRPTFESRWSGTMNLEWLRRYHDQATTSLPQLLDYVGLDPDDPRPVAAYSLGMQQRLALAAALLKNPKLLILDEPTIGLDPTGIADFRDLAQELAGRQGISILISSHLLDGMQRICDRVVVIADGRLQVTGTLAELLGHSNRVRLVAEPLDEALNSLIAAGYSTEVSNGCIEISDAEPEAVARVLFDAGLYATSIEKSAGTLEDLFHQFTVGVPPSQPGGER